MMREITIKFKYKDFPAKKIEIIRATTTYEFLT